MTDWLLESFQIHLYFISLITTELFSSYSRWQIYVKLWQITYCLIFYKYHRSSDYNFSDFGLNTFYTLYFNSSIRNGEIVHFILIITLVFLAYIFSNYIIHVYIILVETWRYCYCLLQPGGPCAGSCMLFMWPCPCSIRSSI